MHVVEQNRIGGGCVWDGDGIGGGCAWAGIE